MSVSPQALLQLGLALGIGIYSGTYIFKPAFVEQKREQRSRDSHTPAAANPSLPGTGIDLQSQHQDSGMLNEAAGVMAMPTDRSTVSESEIIKGWRELGISKTGKVDGEGA